MTEFSFGMSPTADKCELNIPCIYDEIPAEDKPLDRWFEIEGGKTLFSVGTEPVTYEELIEKEFSVLDTLEF
jgi:hypothetical protein